MGCAAFEEDHDNTNEKHYQVDLLSNDGRRDARNSPDAFPRLTSTQGGTELSIREVLAQCVDSPFPIEEGLLSELAQYYAETVTGRQLIDKGMSLHGLREMIRDPDTCDYTSWSGFQPSNAELFQRALQELKTWTPSQVKHLQEQHRQFAELKKNNPDNPLFRNGGVEAPPHFVSVYHLTNASKFEGIAQKGLRPRGETLQGTPRWKERGAQWLHLNEVFHRHQRWDLKHFDHLHSVFAYDDYHQGLLAGKEEETLGNGTLLIEIKADPRVARVADLELVNEAGHRLAAGDEEGAAEFGRRYWDTSVTLQEFRSLQLRERQQLFRKPEVIIPQGIDTKYLRACPPSEQCADDSPQQL